MGLGLVRGLGFTVGGMASSSAHETHGLLVIGKDSGDMAAALADVVEMGGGVAIRDGGRLTARAELPLGGIMSDRDMPGTVQMMADFNSVLRSRGAPWPDPLLPVVFMCFTSILHLRITCSGVFDVRAGRIIYNGAG